MSDESITANADELADQLVDASFDLSDAAPADVAAEADDELVMKYLDGQELSVEEIQQGLALSTRAGKVVPVLCGAALQNIGARALMDAIVAYLPDPAFRAVTGTNPVTQSAETLQANIAEPLAAMVLKTLADPFVGKLTYFRVYSGSLHSDTRVYNAGRQAEERIGGPPHLHPHVDALLR